MKRLILVLFTVTCSLLYPQSGKFYWNNPVSINQWDSGIFQLISGTDRLAVLYVKSDLSGLVLAVSRDEQRWDKVDLNVPYYSTSPMIRDFFGMITGSGKFIAVIRDSEKTMKLIKIDLSDPQYKTETAVTLTANDFMGTPVFEVDNNGNIILAYSTLINQDYGLEVSVLDANGNQLSRYQPGNMLRSTVNPAIGTYNGRIFLFYQAKDRAVQEGLYYNIYFEYSNDGGTNWSGPSTAVLSRGENNQMPSFAISDKGIELVWEREVESVYSLIFYRKIDLSNFKLSDEVQISSNNTLDHGGVIKVINGDSFIFWYGSSGGVFKNYYTDILDNVSGNRQNLPSNGRGGFISVAVYKNKPNLSWLTIRDNGNTIYNLSQDSFVAAPVIRSQGDIFNKRELTVNWGAPDDVSGLSGFRILLTRNQADQISEQSTLLLSTQDTKVYESLNEGIWFFKIKSYDRAGNVSVTAVYRFEIDVTKPQPPLLNEQEYDSYGYLKNNSFSTSIIRGDEELYGHRFYYRHFPIYNIDLVASADNTADKIVVFDRAGLSIQMDRYVANGEMSQFTLVNGETLSLNGLSNGALLVGYSASDKAGNRSDIQWARYYLNKVKPVTVITRVSSVVNASGGSLLFINGSGFTLGGTVEEIYISKSRSSEEANYTLRGNRFSVVNDALVRQTVPIEIEDGNYFIGIKHSDRGVVFSDYRINFTGRWYFRDGEVGRVSIRSIRSNLRYLNINWLFWIIIILLWVLSFGFILRTMFIHVTEKITIARMLRQIEQFKQLQNESSYPIRSVQKMKRGLGLTVKYTFLILLLVVFIVTATAITLGFISLRNETINLAEEMKDKANLSINSFAASISDNYKYKEEFYLAVDITKIVPRSVPDISFAMIYKDEGAQEYIEYGSTERLFFEAVDNFENLTPEQKNNIINDLVKTGEVNEILNGYSVNPDLYNDEKFYFPEFAASELQNKYIIMKPIIYTDTQSGNKTYGGFIVVGYSFERILATIREQTYYLIRVTIFVTLIALVISFFGAVFLATTTIRPIKMISKHVNIIISMDDYENLEGTENEKLIINTRDEIATLANAINDMTHKLIEKAKADKQLLLGKEIQKKFIPLEPHQTEYIDIYGFYEGAKGVSGDYFDYKKIDDEHYAFIMCDVAGKAVPAALIMVQISTIFNAFVSNFKSGKDKIETVSVVTQINDTVAERGFVGRFAAIVVLILNVKSGKLILTNAGYTQLLTYSVKSGKTEWLKLDQNSGAAGVFPSYMLPNPYKQEQYKVEKGDMLFLFTDGIEESRNGTTYMNENNEETPDEFGLKRLVKVIESSPEKSPQSVIESIVKAEKEYRGKIEQYDDLTLLAVMRV